MLSCPEAAPKRSETMSRTPFLLILPILLLLSGPGVSTAQDVDAEVNAVVRRLERGDAKALMVSSADRLELALFGATRRYSRAQATYVIEDFFRQYPPRRVIRVEGAGTDQAWFGSLSYEYARGSRPLDLFVRMRREGSEWVLNELIVREEG